MSTRAKVWWGLGVAMLPGLGLGLWSFEKGTWPYSVSFVFAIITVVCWLAMLVWAIVWLVPRVAKGAWHGGKGVWRATKWLAK